LVDPAIAQRHPQIPARILGGAGRARAYAQAHADRCRLIDGYTATWAGLDGGVPKLGGLDGFQAAITAALWQCTRA